MKIRRCARNCKRRAPSPPSGEIAQRPASQETCLRRRPRPAGTSLRCVAPRGPTACAVPPRRHVNVSFQEDRHELISTSRSQHRAQADPEIVVTAVARAGRRRGRAGLGRPSFDEEEIDDARRCRRRRTCCGSRPASRSRRPGRAAPRPRSASAAPRPITACSSSTASASTIPPPATRRGSSC